MDHSAARGALAGTAAVLLLQPLDVAKTRVQARGGGALVPALRSVLRQHGARGLWAGTLPSVLRAAPGAAVYFWAVDAMSRRVRVSPATHLSSTGRAGGERRSTEKGLNARPPSKHGGAGQTLDRGRAPDALRSAAIGAAARALATVAVMPFTVLKTRMEAGVSVPAHRPFMYAHARAMYRTRGPRAFFLGVLPTLLRDAPYAGVHLAAYRTLREVPLPAAIPDAAATAACSGAAAIVATLVTHPFDVLKTRVQLGIAPGPRGLLAGVAPRLVRKALSSAIAWLVFEHVIPINVP